MTMLQFGGAMCNAVARFAPRTIWRINSQQLLALSSSVAANPVVTPIINEPKNIPQPENNISEESQQHLISRNPLVKAAFAAILNQEESSKPLAATRSSIMKELFSATSVENLLTITTNREISRRHAIHAMSILSHWMRKNKTSLQEFEEDPRFLQLCQQLAGKEQMIDRYKDHQHGDLATILSLTGDDEAAKLISSLSLDQMIKVMSTLARKRRRSLTILRALSFHISRLTEDLNIKQSADLLYSMAVLNFPDELLLERAKENLIQTIPKNKGNAVISSISTSLGFLRYKSPELLDSLCEWIIAETRSLQPQVITSLLLTLATVGYTPSNAPTLCKVIIKPLKEADLPASELWLDVVWATVVLGFADSVQVSSVLDSLFIQKLEDMQCLTVPRKVKLLNINAAAQLIVPNYKGPFLSEDLEWNTIAMEKSKDKQIYLSSVLDTLSNLFPTSTCINTNVNTGIGFVLDAECYADDKCNPLPIDQVASKHENATRIAIIALSYVDFCRGKNEPLGMYSLMMKLLGAKGYRIVSVPYIEYHSKEKLVTRVKYLEQKIKSVINPSST